MIKDNLKDGVVKLQKELKKALTPPTAEEVCEALSELYGSVTFDKHYNEFTYHLGISGDEVCSIDLDDLLNRKRYDLITLIGSFYEGLINND